MEKETVISDREAMYKKFEDQKKSVSQPNLTAPAPDAGTPGTPPEKKETVPSTIKEEPKQPEEKSKEPDMKMVPLAALQESREKEKSLREDLKQTKAQMDILVSDLQELTLKKQIEEPIEDYDKALIDLRRELAEKDKKIAKIESEIAKRSDYEKEKERETAKESINKQIDQTNDRLEKDGFPGFKKFVPLVTARLQVLVEEDSANRYLDTPEGWMKIYRESVFPSVREVSIDEKLKAKEEKKKEAAIPTGSGGAPASSAPKDEEWTVEKYMEMRRKRLNT